MEWFRRWRVTSIGHKLRRVDFQRFFLFSSVVLSRMIQRDVFETSHFITYEIYHFIDCLQLTQEFSSELSCY